MAADKLLIVLDAAWRGKSAVQAANSDVSKLDSGVSKSKNALKGLAVAGGVAAAGIAAFGVAAKVAWDILGDGAALAKSRDEFERLTVSIGTTADAMLGKMREATSGMVSDAELIAGAGQIMSLGLADTEEGVVRLAALVSGLGWDMGQVILTFANDSVMRLDALGLAVEDVMAKKDALVAGGMDAGAAFDLAVIEAGEEKYRLLGDAAETTQGKMKMLESAFTNANNAFKESFANELSDELDNAADSADNLSSSIVSLATVGGQALGSLIGITAQLAADLQGVATMVRMLAGGQALEFGKYALGYAASGNDPEKFYQSLSRFNTSAPITKPIGPPRTTSDLSNTSDAMKDLSTSVDDAAESYKNYNSEAVVTRLETANMLGVMSRTNEVEELGNTIGGVGIAAETAADKMARLAAETGSFFDQARRGQDFDPAEAFYQSALAAGASAEQLRDLLITTGLETPERADEIYSESIIRQLADMAGQAFAGGDNLDMLWQGIQAGVANPAWAQQVTEQTTVNEGDLNLHIEVYGNVGYPEFQMVVDDTVSTAVENKGSGNPNAPKG